jgi:diguanylate cyclase (GGDEF)-like protein
MPLSSSNLQQWSFARFVGVPISLSFLAISIIFSFALLSSTHTADTVSIERQSSMVARAVDIMQDQLVQDLAIVAVWNDTLEMLRSARSGWTPEATTFMDEMVGNSMHDDHGHDRTYAVDGDGTPLYAMLSKQRVDPTVWYTVAPAIQPMIDELQRGQPVLGHGHCRLGAAGKAHLTRLGVRLPKRAVFTSHLVRLEGQPAIVSVARVVPHSATLQPRPADPMLVAVRFLDAGFLDELALRNLIGVPRLANSPAEASGDETLVLSGEAGPVGYLVWRAERPGADMRRHILPVAALSIALAAAVILWLARRLQHATTGLAAAEARALALANSDALTGLPNRLLLNRRLDELIERGEPFALVLIDLDGLKELNDKLGHAAGDTLLREFAERLALVVPNAAVPARLGGDEYAVLSPLSDVEMLCANITARGRDPYSIESRIVQAGASVGYAAFPAHARSAPELLRCADEALYTAKRSGRDCWRPYLPSDA